MAVKLHPAGKCFRFLFILINLFVFLLALALIGFGAYLLITHNDFEYLTGSRIASGGAILIAAGVAGAAITFIGMCGACGLWTFVLAFYAIVVALIVILEIAAGIVGFVYRNELGDRVDGRATDAIQSYNGTSSAEDSAIDFIQNEFKCCGWTNYTNWLNTLFVNRTGLYPESCECPPDSDDCISPGPGAQEIWKEACNDGVLDFLRRSQYILGAMGVAFGIVEISAVLIACGLVCCIHKAKNEYTTV